METASAVEHCRPAPPKRACVRDLKRPRAIMFPVSQRPTLLLQSGRWRFTYGTGALAVSGETRREIRQSGFTAKSSLVRRSWSRILDAMETIRITTDTSRHAGCGGLLGMSAEAPLYIVEHEGLETRLPGIEMVCLTCGGRIRSQYEVEVVQE
jgi:hypothetical protein